MSTATPPQLVPFPDTPEAEYDLRSTALAWDMLANTGEEAARPKAKDLLQHAVVKFPNDPSLLSSLGYEEQRAGDMAAARDLYVRAIELDPKSIDAAANLGVIEAQHGNLPRAIDLWRGVFERVPGKSSVGLNLARALCADGQLGDARAVINRILEFNPDFGSARQFQKQINQPNASCD